jgi:hypothetical protein
MTDRNWEKEMAKIDKQLASVSDEQLLADRKALAAGAGASPAAGKSAAPLPPAVRAGSAEGRTWIAWVKVTVAVTAAASLMFWPWPARCGLPLIGFTAATGGVTLLGLWSAFGTWRHRLGLAHVASLLVLGWGAVLGAREVLPRIGYAVPSLERPGQWTCDGLPPLPTPTTVQPSSPAVPPVTIPVTPP